MIDLFDPSLQTDGGKRFGADDIVGNFRSGYQVNGTPASLTEWRVTTGDPDAADSIAKALGASAGPQTWETKTEQNIEVFTTSGEVEVLLDGAAAIDARMLIWPRGQKKIVVCDNSVFETDGKPYVCEMGGFRNRAEHEEQGHVCEPRVSVTFRLADDPDLGLWKFESGAWSLATVVGKAIGDLAKIEGTAKATLGLERVEMKNGNVFTKPVVTILGAAE